MSSQITTVFTNYQKARSQFAQNVAELAMRPQNFDYLKNVNALHLLKPLLGDEVPAIRQTAAMAVARLAAGNESIAIQVVDESVLPQIMSLINYEDSKDGPIGRKPCNAARHLKKAGAIVLRSVARHSAELAQAVVNEGGVKALNLCLEEFDPGVKEASSWTLGYLASHSEFLANALIEAGSIPLLVLCLQEPELHLKRVALSALSDISKHSNDSARATIDAGAITFASKLILHRDPKIRKQACGFLSTIAKHNVDLAEVVVDAEVLNDLITLLQDDDVQAKKNSADCLREIAKHSVELARLIVSNGGLMGVIDVVNQDQEETPSSTTLSMAKLPAVMCIGYIAGFSETLAATAISCKALDAVKNLLTKFNESLETSKEECTRVHVCNQFILLQAAIVWAVGKIGFHSPVHSEACAQSDMLRLLSMIYLTEDFASNELPVEVLDDLRNKAGESLSEILDKCTHLPALQALLIQNETVETKLTIGLLGVILRQIGKVLPNDRKGRKAFVQSGALQFVQTLESKLSVEDFEQVSEVVNSINGCYPPQIVNYYSPKHADELIKLLDEEGSENENEDTKNVEEKS